MFNFFTVVKYLFGFSLVVFSTPTQTQAVGLVSLPGHALNIFGEDGREQVKDPQYPLTAVGQFQGGGTMCSAALVAEDLALTNAHCLVAAMGEKSEFFLGKNGDNFLASSKIKMIHFPGEKLKDGSYSIDILRGDWALVRLEKNLGKKFGFFRVASLGNTVKSNSTLEVHMAGYSADQNKAQTLLQQKCFIRGRTPFGSYMHDCDMTKGASGSPIYVLDKYGIPFIIAVNNTESDPTQKLPNNSLGYKLNQYDPNFSNGAVDAKNFIPALQILETKTVLMDKDIPLALNSEQLQQKKQVYQSIVNEFFNTTNNTLPLLLPQTKKEINATFLNKSQIMSVILRSNVRCGDRYFYGSSYEVQTIDTLSIFSSLTSKPVAIESKDQAKASLRFDTSSLKNFSAYLKLPETKNEIYLFCHSKKYTAAEIYQKMNNKLFSSTLVCEFREQTDLVFEIKLQNGFQSTNTDSKPLSNTGCFLE